MTLTLQRAACTPVSYHLEKLCLTDWEEGMSQRSIPAVSLPPNPGLE